MKIRELIESHTGKFTTFRIIDNVRYAAIEFSRGDLNNMSLLPPWFADAVNAALNQELEHWRDGDEDDGCICAYYDGVEDGEA